MNMNVHIPPPQPHDQWNIISATWTWRLASHPTPPYDQRNIISATWTWRLASHPNPPYDQRNIISVTWTWTLTSHPTPPQPIIKQKQKRANKNNKQTNTKKATKHPGALQRPWRIVISFVRVIVMYKSAMLCCTQFVNQQVRNIISYQQTGCKKKT